MTDTDAPIIRSLTKAEWIEQLRSHPKAKGQLCATEVDDGEVTVTGYCCLGVLAAVEGAMRFGREGFPEMWAPYYGDNDVEYRWMPPDEADEEYRGHPTLPIEAQSVLIRLNDVSEDFEELVIPAIEVLLQDDLSLKPEHQRPLGLVALLGQVFSSDSHDDAQRHRAATRLLALLQEGKTLPKLRASDFAGG